MLAVVLIIVAVAPVQPHPNDIAQVGNVGDNKRSMLRYHDLPFMHQVGVDFLDQQ
jgi:hypothetical protein